MKTNYFKVVRDLFQGQCSRADVFPFEDNDIDAANQAFSAACARRDELQKRHERHERHVRIAVYRNPRAMLSWAGPVIGHNPGLAPPELYS